MRLYTDGAESGDTSRLSSPAYAGVSTTYKRPGGGAYSYSINTQQNTERILPSTYSELFLRVAYYFTTNTVPFPFLAVVNGSTIAVQIKNKTFGLGAGTVEAFVGSTSVAVSSQVNLQIAEWHVWELHVLLSTSPAVGKIQLKFDGTQIIDYTGNTGSAASVVDRLRIYGTASSVANYFDDIAVNDTSGASDNSWVGDGIVMAALIPNGAGAYTDLIASAGTPYQCIDEIPFNDTDYVYESTVGKKSTYTMSDLGSLPTGATIQRVWVEIVGKIMAADGSKIATLVRSGGVDSQGSDQAMTISNARYLSQEYLTDPADSQPWTSAKVNALEAGAVIR